jgi:hypothetical protein
VKKFAIKIVGRSRIEIVVDVARDTAAGFVLAAMRACQAAGSGGRA